ncbi:transporter substrate-binding domain-containing protein [Paraburkholderia dipogonis]|uniref:transporter substrate-binding domain-containing protein n=1 Tax=Paraburkholderia dipogonis TaxID=1211383 RepID=UPI0035EF6536
MVDSPFFGVDASYPPFESKWLGTASSGFDIDLGHEICARMKAKCVVVWGKTTSDGMIPRHREERRSSTACCSSDVHDAATRPQQIEPSSNKMFTRRRRLVAKKGSGHSGRRPTRPRASRVWRGKRHDPGNLRGQTLLGTERARRLVPVIRQPGIRSMPDLLSGRLTQRCKDAGASWKSAS